RGPPAYLIMANPELPATSPTLLRLLALPGAEGAWEVFVSQYGPLIDSRCRRAGLQPADVEDVRGSVYAQLVEALRGFRYDPQRRFRGYLQRVVDNAIRSHWRVLRRRPGWVGDDSASDELPAPLETLGRELDDGIRPGLDVLLRAVDRVRFEVGESAWQAFELTALDGLSGAEAAARLGRSVAAVYMAKSRVLTRIRAEAAYPPDDDHAGG
ncbi:MAG: RNA polymerase sigma factor, partial [Isosphaeraceae bacterium]